MTTTQNWQTNIVWADTELTKLARELRNEDDLPARQIEMRIQADERLDFRLTWMAIRDGEFRR